METQDTSDAMEMSALGIKVFDQTSLEKSVQREVVAVVAEHALKQKLNILERELKEVSADIESAQKSASKCDEKRQALYTRISDPRRYAAVDDEAKQHEIHLSNLQIRLESIRKELNVTQKIEVAEIEDGEIIEEEPETEHDRLVRLGEITPFAGSNFSAIKPFSPSKSIGLQENVISNTNYNNSVFLDFENTSLSNIKTSSKNKLLTNFSTITGRGTSNESGCSLSFNDSKLSIKGTSKTFGASRQIKRKCSKLLKQGSTVRKAKCSQRAKSSELLSEVTELDVSSNEDTSSEASSDYVPSEDSDSDNSDALSTLSEGDVKHGVKRKHKTESKDSTERRSADKRPASVRRRERVLDDSKMKNYENRLKKWKYEILQKSLANQQIDDDNDDESNSLDNFEELGYGIRVPTCVWDRLYRYQQTGVRWLWELHQQRCGGILGDEMGLGKTVQVIAFLAGLRCAGTGSSETWSSGRVGQGPVLVVCPATLLHQWLQHLHHWWPPFRVAVLHNSGCFEGDRKILIHNINKSSGILITSYSGVTSHLETLLAYNWHYMILDEGHKIRNPDAQITVAVKRFNTPHRLILSGSPIQNNLKELWSLFDFVFPGKLGTLHVFLQQFAVPITQGGYSNASRVEVETGYKCAVMLRDTISPYLLRRMKADVKTHLTLPSKSEQVLFCGLTEEQKKYYKEYVNGDQLAKIMNGRLKVFVGLINLRKLCNHPDLYSGGHRLYSGETEADLPQSSSFGWWQRSGKMQVIHGVLKLWKRQGHKVLLFTQSTQMLFILEKYLKMQGYSYLKMDGKTAVGARQGLVQRFNAEPDVFVFLLTTRVGGLGVNLTGADRVLIYDPDWNPSTDIQARERAWRIGQMRDVTVYRLLTAGTIEEKIYHRQIFKQFLTNRVLKDPKQQRFFKTNDLYELFTFNDDIKSKTESSSLFAGMGSNIKPKQFSHWKGSQLKDAKLKRSISSSHSVAQFNTTFQVNQKISTHARETANFRTRECNSAVDNTNNCDIKHDRNLKGKPNKMQSSSLLNINSNITSSVTNVHGEADNNVHYEKNEAEVNDGDVKKKERMRMLARILSQRIGQKSLATDNDLNNIHSGTTSLDHSCESGKVEKRKKGKKFEGERLEYLVKKRKYRPHSADTEEESAKETIESQKSQDNYVLSKLFKSGVHSALRHDVIVNSDKTDYLLLEAEADRVANEAMEAVRASRFQYHGPRFRSTAQASHDHVDDLSTRKKRKFGPAKKSDIAALLELNCTNCPDERNSPFSCEKSDGTDFSGQKLLSKCNGPLSAVDLLNATKNHSVGSPALLSSKDAAAQDTATTQNVDLLNDIRSFVAFQARHDGCASTDEIVHKFKDRLPPNRTHVFKALLKQICEFRRNPDTTGMWYVKSEFQ